MRWILHLNVVIELTDLNVTYCFDFCCFRAITQQSIFHVVVNWEVFTINL